MKIKTQPRIVDNSNTTSQDLIKQLQAMVDDIRLIGKGGLSFADGQLPFQFREVTVTNGVSFTFTMNAPYTIIGCVPIQTNGAVVTSFQTNLTNNKFNVTVTLDKSPSTIGFLLIGS